MNKKAQSIMNVFEMMWKLILVIIVIVVLSGVIYLYLNETMTTDNLQMNVLFQKIVNSPDCLGYKDIQNNFQVQNAIDISKFNSDLPRKCIIRDDYGVILTLLNTAGTKIGQAKIITLDQEKLMPVCKVTRDFKCYKKSSFILYNNGTDFKPAILQMEAIKNAE